MASASESQLGQLLGGWGEAFNGLQVLIVTYAFSVIGAILILIVGWSISRLLGRWVRSLLTRSHRVDPTVVGFFSVFVRYAVLVVVVIMVLGQFGVQTASIITALGAAGLAIGLALQGTLQNIAAGIMLLVLRPFRVGEYIDADGVSGTIQEIGLFATELKTLDGLYRMAPNSQLWNVPVTNYSRLPERRHDLVIGIGYEDDIEKAQSVLMDLARADSRVLSDPEPWAYVSELGDSAVAVTLRYWTKSADWWTTSREMTKAAKIAFDENGISIPFPQVTYSGSLDVEPREPEKTASEQAQ
ncbi:MULTISPECIES: mechanosensitive ion channel family protein [Hoeflea]|uniref:Small-conductance mechanosensitive channel n=1 Tax=Hoeflea alexandrii TaxID=288436 RepID=A0ABT1CME7_9HYPH|nr:MULTISPECIES: mechanosensitive ion channel domain-containing protein [Hoeflea]MCO6407108.1 mechanosensitive ion channel [Hoeflea alexandrii]MCY0154465.1 mechanosensitive ion channel [Hoeflea alexandrii]